MTTPKTPARAHAGRNSIRIIGGRWRGRRIAFADLPELRPTPDRVRETLFNWLQQAIQDARCLDLFAGSGALGLEALSRGAREAVFVEQAAAAAAALREQLVRLGAAAQAEVHQCGAERFLRTAAAPFDVVFLDPPYGRDALGHFLPMIETGQWLAPGAHIYLEGERAAGVPPLPAHWRLLKSKSAGEVGYHLARKEL
ncbi:MAG TPA: 16S rRNA (guanine(966)-N(2))-methyltransferase RsmD [Steroidobacteraceae bacterium]|nr:16S rRNA (guanine(966)-N(2))-methyltransferase RsmD [Steroidobacteraceae bacterium]